MKSVKVRQSYTFHDMYGNFYLKLSGSLAGRYTRKKIFAPACSRMRSNRERPRGKAGWEQGRTRDMHGDQITSSTGTQTARQPLAHLKGFSQKIVENLMLRCSVDLDL